MRWGKLIRNGVRIQPHEEFAIEFLLERGFNIELIAPVNTPKNKNPDFLIDNVPWELKSPITKNKKTIQRLIKETNRQSSRIIVDIRRIRLNEEMAISILEYEFRKSHRVRELMILTSSAILRYKK